MANSDVAVVTHRFGVHELAIRRLYAVDPEFRAACADYADAVGALVHWQSDPSRATEYRHLIAELESEIRRFLEVPSSKGGNVDRRS